MPSPVLHAEQLTIGYAPPRRAPVAVARGVEDSLLAGEVVCLLGPNGVGKSTLLRTLAGMQAPLAGRLLLDGRPLAEYSARDLARRRSVVLTERLDTGALTVRALVGLGRHPYTSLLGVLTAADHAVVERCLEAVQATALAERPVSELSDGERQRVMIARALAQEPALVLLDEPTAFLDLPHRVAILHLLRHLARTQQMAILLSTHDLDLALRHADRLWLLTPGGTLTHGAPEDLVLNGSFACAFAGAGLSFDPATGAFRLPPAHAGRLALRATGLVAEWTRRALERDGYEVVTGDPETAAPAGLVEAVGDTPRATRWRLTHAARTTEHAALYDLLAQLHQTRGE